MEYEFHYSRFPALKSYIDRIGAEQLNFRRFMVKEYHGSHYYVEKVLIRITDDYDIDCRSEEYAPTEQEAAAIREELGKVDFPKSVPAGPADIEHLLGSGLVTGQLFQFYDISRSKVLMCQERRDNVKDKIGKIYVPWTLFKAKGERGQWRQMEPDGALPFWKPRKRRELANLMVHEGAKTAAFVDGLINDPERRNERKGHPWSEELARFEHWGAIGGALATHRCDFEELRQLSIEGDLYYSCDKDHSGIEAVKTFSRMWGGRIYALKFDDTYPEGWDLADKLPEALFNRAGTIQRPLMNYADPVTWATKRMEKKHEAGRLGYTLTKDFQSEWVHTVNPEMFAHSRMSHKRFTTAQAFNSFVRPFSDVDDTSKYMRAAYDQKTISIKYDPARKPGVFSDDDGNHYYNLYIPGKVMDYSDREARHIDYSPWQEFLAKLVPIEAERVCLEKWAATLIAKPGHKMNYGILLVSEMQGVGKTTFADTLAMILGKSNTWQASENQIIGNFNDWAEKQLVVVPEIYAGHSSKAYNILKEVITDKTLTFNRKFIAPYNVDNHVHIVACSNSMRALKLDNSDRRWFVPLVSQIKHGEKYWTAFHDWRDQDDGLRKVKLWAKRYIHDHGYVEIGSEAPTTQTKREMIEENDSAGMEFIRGKFRMIREVVEANGAGEDFIPRDSYGDEVGKNDTTKLLIKAAKEGRPIVLLDCDCRNAINELVYSGKAYERLEKLLTIRKIAREEGLYIGKERVKTTAVWKRAFNARIISTSQETALTDPDEVLHAAAQENGELYLINLHDLARELSGIF